MSENASDCTLNAAYRDKKLKKNYGEGAQPATQSPSTLGTETPLRQTPPLGAFGASIVAPLALDMLPVHCHHLPLLFHTSGYGPVLSRPLNFYRASAQQC